MMLSTLKHVLSSRVSSAANRLRATSTAIFVGTLVNRDTTSKETKISPSSSCCVAVKSTKSLVLRTADADFPTSGDRRSERCLERW